MRSAHASSFTIALLVALLPACDGCHAKKPYTPYTLSDAPSASSSADPAPAPSPPADGGPAFAAVAGTAAPDGARWPLGEGAVDAPPGYAFTQGLVLDADGDGKPDLLAWARAPDGLRGELWFASGKAPGEGRLVAALPADLTTSGCTAQATLSLVGPRTAALDFEPRCPARVRERAARWIALVRFVGGPPEIGAELRLGAPADGESLAVALESADRDGDGRADIQIKLTLSGAPSPLPSGGSASAMLAFLERPAGLSRDPTEPEASLRAIGTALIADGRKKTTAPRIPALAEAARRLHALLCEDAGGTRPVVTTTAGPIRCGDLRLAEEAAIAEVEAALNLGDPLAAMAALGRLDAVVPQHRKDVDALVARSIPSGTGTLVRTTAAIPLRPLASGFSPLAFEADGALLVRTADRVVRVDKVTFAESAADPSVTWPKELQWPPDTPTWSLGRVEDACDQPLATARFGYAGAVTPVSLPVPTPARCVAGGPPVDLLGTGSQGFLFAYRGDVMAIPAAAPPRVVLAESFAAVPGAPVERGTARSPGGGALAVTTSRGVLVAVLKGSARGATARLVTGPQLDGGRACVPSDGGERLACVVAQGAAIYEAR
jgi:hypothetical protein